MFVWPSLFRRRRRQIVVKIEKAQICICTFCGGKGGQIQQFDVQRQCPMAILFTIRAAVCTIYIINLQKI